MSSPNCPACGPTRESGLSSDPVLLPSTLLDRCLIKYKPGVAPSHNGTLVTLSGTQDAATPVISLSAGLMKKACGALQAHFHTLPSLASENRLRIFVLCSPTIGEALPADAAISYLSTALESDVIVFNADDFALGDSSVFGKDVCALLWTMYGKFYDLQAARVKYAQHRSPEQNGATDSGPLRELLELFLQTQTRTDRSRWRTASFRERPSEAIHDADCEECAACTDSLKDRQASLDIATTKVKEIFQSLISLGSPSQFPRRRLLYLRNFSAIHNVFFPLVPILQDVVSESRLPIVVVAGLWQVERLPCNSDSKSYDNFMNAFSDPHALTEYVRATYAPALRLLRDGHTKPTDLSDLFTAAIRSSYGLDVLDEDSVTPEAASVIHQALQVGLDPYAQPLPGDDRTSSKASRFAFVNVSGLCTSIFDSGIHFNGKPASIAIEWSDRTTSSAQVLKPTLHALSTSLLSTDDLESLATGLVPFLPMHATVTDLIEAVEQFDAVQMEIQSLITAESSLTGHYASIAAKAVESVCNELGLSDADFVRLLQNMIVDPSAIDTRFEDVCISPDVVNRLRSTITLPHLYSDAYSYGILHVASIDGVLLYGPPGTGKTMLCRAIARTSGARMIQVTASDIESRFPGESETRLRIIFSVARRLTPCVIFIDEIDALFPKAGPNSVRWHRTLVTGLMQEMDGLRTSSKQGRVIVVAATNRPFDLDDALLRRLPCQILVDLPDQMEREKILRQYLEGETTDETVEIGAIARRTPFFSGSDLKDLVHSAARIAFLETVPDAWMTTPVLPLASSAQQQRRIISARHFEQAQKEVNATCLKNMAGLQQLRRFAHAGQAQPTRLERLSSWAHALGTSSWARTLGTSSWTVTQTVQMRVRNLFRIRPKVSTGPEASTAPASGTQGGQ